jgi:hypothetical protein
MPAIVANSTALVHLPLPFPGIDRSPEAALRIVAMDVSPSR